MTANILSDHFLSTEQLNTLPYLVHKTRVSGSRFYFLCLDTKRWKLREVKLMNQGRPLRHRTHPDLIDLTNSIQEEDCLD